MKETVNQIIQDLTNNKNHPLFKEQLAIISRDEYIYRQNLIKHKWNKIKRSLSDNITRGIGSILSFIFSILWFIIIFPYRCIEILIMICKLPYQCKEHKKLMNMVQSHPEFIKLKRKDDYDCNNPS